MKNMYKQLDGYVVCGPLPENELLYKYGLKADYFRINSNWVNNEGDPRLVLHVRRFESVDDINLYKIFEPNWNEVSTHLIVGNVGDDLTTEDIKGLL